MDLKLVSQGAEARIYESTLLGVSCVVKERFAKAYRHPDLDRQLRRAQVTNELRSLLRCSRVGIRVPTLLWVDRPNARIYMERLPGVTVKQWLQAHEASFEGPECAWLVAEMGAIIARMHRQAGSCWEGNQPREALAHLPPTLQRWFTATSPRPISWWTRSAVVCISSTLASRAWAAWRRVRCMRAASSFAR